MTKVANRNAGLEQMLRERQRELQDAVHDRIRAGRAEPGRESGDDLDYSDASVQSDLALALVQMKAETLARIDEALARFEAGEYGSCVECEEEISEARLRALPFAVRCLACEEQREDARRRAQAVTHTQSPFSGMPAR